MNIAFAKIGKSIKFASPYSPIGGDNEAPAMIRLLANNNPDKKFWIVGRSDFSKLSKEQYYSLFHYDNVFDAFDGHTGPAKPHVIRNFFESNGIKINFSIFMIGQIGTVTIPEKIQQINDPSLIASVIDMTKNYSTPVIEWMNDCPTPFVEIVNDPRYTLAQSRDIIPNPKVTLSQWNGSYLKKTIRSYEDQTRDTHTINMKYAEMEKIFLYDREKPSTQEKSINFAVVLNEGSPSRYNMLNEWVLSKFSDVSVYGKWEHAAVENDSRFKGSLQINQIQELFNSVKYTFIIPIAPEWTTSKYIEMIHAGVIPFLHPTYDSQLNVDIPDILRPKSPAEMMNSISKIESIDGGRERLLRVLSAKFLNPDLYDGSRLNKIVFSSMIDNFVPTDLSRFERVKYESPLDSFF